MLFNFAVRSVIQNYNLDSHINCQNDWMFLLTHQPRIQKSYCSIFQILPWEWNHIQDVSSFMALVIAFHPRGERIVFWWPNTNTNIIRLFKNDRIRIRILFGLKKATEYEYKYYLVWKKQPNTNTNIIRLEKIDQIRIRILFGFKKSPEYGYEY